MQTRLTKEFFSRDVLAVAPDLIGKQLIVNLGKPNLQSHVITEVEAYRGEEDKACHACKGKTKRTEIMYREGGCLYIYLIYGMYWMLNIVTGEAENPQAVLIRGILGFNGPGKLCRELGITGVLNGENITTSNQIWLAEGPVKHVGYSTHPRIGIDYAGDYWKNKPWRFLINNS